MQNIKIIDPKSGKKYFINHELSTDIKNRAVRGAGITVLSQFTLYGIQMIGTIILARLLTPNDFGMVAMVTVFAILIQNFGVRGFTEATIQSTTINHKKISTLFWIHVGLSICIMFLFIFISPLIAKLYGEPKLIPICIAISISIVLNALSTQHIALLTRQMEFYKITGNEIIATFAGTIVSILFAWKGTGYWALVARRVVPIIAMTFGAWLLCRWLPGLPSKNTGAKQMLKFGMNAYGNFTMNYFSRNLDKILIGWRNGAQSLGFYERAYYLFVMPVSQLTYPLTNVAVAALSRLRENPKKFKRYYLKSLSLIALIGMPLSAILTLIGNDFLFLLLGPQWKKAGEIFTVFGPAIGVLIVYGTHGWIHLSLGRADRWFRWGIIELIVSTICFLIGLSFGVLGVAIAYSVCFYLLFLPGLWYACKPIKIKLILILFAIWKPYLAALSAGILCWSILHSNDIIYHSFINLNIILRIILNIIICLSLYFAFIIFLFKGKKAIVELYSVLREMKPNIA